MSPLEVIKARNVKTEDIGENLAARVDLIFNVSGRVEECPSCEADVERGSIDDWDFCPFCGESLDLRYDRDYNTLAEAKKDKHAEDFGVNEFYKYTVYAVSAERPELVLGGR